MKAKDKPSKSMTFLPGPQKILLRGEKTVLQAALRNKVQLSHSCGGNATCGTCRVLVQSDLKSLSPRNALEQEMADDRGFSSDERLACQLEPQDGLIVLIPKPGLNQG